jgi:hypothetical protein
MTKAPEKIVSNFKLTLNFGAPIGEQVYEGIVDLIPSVNPLNSSVNPLKTLKDKVFDIVNNDNSYTNNKLTETAIIAIKKLYPNNKDGTTSGLFIGAFEKTDTKTDALERVTTFETNNHLSGGKGPQKGSSSKITRRRKSKGKKRAGTRHHKKGKR